MEVLTFLIALLALVVALLAYVRAGGKEEIRRQMDDLGVKTETAREKTADVLDRLEQMVRGKRAPAEDAATEGESGAGGAAAPEGGGRRGGRKRKGGGG